MPRNKLKGFRRDSVARKPKIIDIGSIATSQITNEDPSLRIAEDFCVIPTQDLCVEEEIVEFRGRLAGVDDSADADGGGGGGWNTDYSAFTFIVLWIEDQVDILTPGRARGGRGEQ